MSMRVARGGAMATLEARFGAVALKTLERFNSEAKRLIEEQIVSGRDSRGFVGRVDTGATKQAVRPGPIERTPRGYRAVVQARPPHDVVMAIIEKGRRRGKKVPAKGSAAWRKVRLWVEKHLRNEALESLRGAYVRLNKKGQPKRGGKRMSAVVSVKGPGAAARVEKAIDNMTFLVLRSIGRRGIPGLFPFRLARERLGPGGGLVRIFREEMRAARLGR